MHKLASHWIHRHLIGHIHQPIQEQSQGFAPVNIALIKYWGKRNVPFNLPQTDSLSIGLNQLGTRTQLTIIETSQHDIYLNDQPVVSEATFTQRLTQFLDTCLPQSIRLRIDTHNDVPTGAGLASSASGFAALVLALNELMGWQLTLSQLSILARLGSGSACRSLWPGYVYWQAGKAPDGRDSLAMPLAEKHEDLANNPWPDLQVGLVALSTEAKAVGSTQGMQRTVERCLLYQQWPQTVKQDMKTLLEAMKTQDFMTFGQTVESNALAMHATMMATQPPVFYWLPETVQTLHQVWQLRQANIPVFFTMDAGPNVKLLYLASNEAAIQAQIPHQVIRPFDDPYPDIS